ncbi:LacI family DNA-binding transcriptional regulator [Sanguibacter antarcticus]|uniref:LacI family transcriptional regulator n=1 Tax=Sanguibacter antarcticus TaxID=372484 RepID=A0A2A9E648_9MICO|nr:LacI family DNA-binding transcriptional regulator [Sanguibacter antarcticus]PFG34313.1 LacI family transcriptional regulator [Sanguibacter antarcticus]
MANVRDVALRAGVSISTVSRALSAPGLVSDATRLKVLEAAKALDYQPNAAARELRVGRTDAIGLLLPDLENPFFASVAKAVHGRARASGISVFTADSDEDPAQELDLVRSLSARVDGLVLASPRASDPDILAAVEGKTVVLLNRQVGDLPTITIDNADGAFQAVNHLRALGHQRIAYASGPAHSWSGEQRRVGMVAAAARIDDVQMVDLGNFQPYFSGGYPAADLAVASGASAVIAYNDLMALGIVDRLRHRGITVPDEMSVVGFDDVAVATLVSPALTTVRIPRAGLGRAAVDLLLGLLGPSPHGDRPDQTVRPPLPVELVVRSSTSVPGADQTAGSRRPMG